MAETRRRPRRGVVAASEDSVIKPATEVKRRRRRSIEEQEQTSRPARKTRVKPEPTSDVDSDLDLGPTDAGAHSGAASRARARVTTKVKSEIDAGAEPEKSNPKRGSRRTKAEPDASPKDGARKRRARRGSTVKAETETETDKPHPEPPNWRDQYTTTQEMRARLPPAAVDTMGCAVLADRSAPRPVQRFQTLVSLMLSSQTKDEVTSATIRRLQLDLPGGLTAHAVAALEPTPEVFHAFIKSVGFHNVKTRNIIAAAKVCRDEHGGDIPRTLEGLTALAGVGPKMAFLTLGARSGWDDVCGIGVDVHVHRIMNRWKWCDTADPDQTRKAIEKWLPKELWRDVNPLLVGLGQLVCGSKPKCGGCDLAEKGICPASTVKPGRAKLAKMSTRAKIAAGIEPSFESDPDFGIRIDSSPLMNKIRAFAYTQEPVKATTTAAPDVIDAPLSTPIPDLDLDHDGVPADQPSLKLERVGRLTSPSQSPSSSPPPPPPPPPPPTLPPPPPTQSSESSSTLAPDTSNFFQHLLPHIFLEPGVRKEIPTERASAKATTKTTKATIARARTIVTANHGGLRRSNRLRARRGCAEASTPGETTAAPADLEDLFHPVA